MLTRRKLINQLKKKSKHIPVILITGYLGSGKTTFLNNLLKQEKRKFAVVVNDMGQINVDAKLYAKALDTNLIELSNGCICCTLRDEFMKEVEKLSEIDGLEAIFVEASGISDPASIASAFLANEQMHRRTSIYISSIITVVDADRIYQEFLGELKEVSSDNNEIASSDTSTLSNLEDDSDPDIINLVIDQIEFCNIILLNK
ncbi:MAG: GTP-binding protein, partial [Butyrivibrio sp.]|nr:GTP-binding protein [Butyrivibrio sp.]